MATTAYMIKKLGVMSVAKFCAILGLIWGIVMGIVVAIGMQRWASYMGVSPAGSGIAAFIFMIIIGVVGGFIGGAIVAFIYNIILGATGGIEMDLEVKT